MAVYNINLLGSPSIYLENSPVNLCRHKSLALIAYLADTRRRMTRSDLSAIFWPDSDLSHALGALRSSLAEINAIEGPHIFTVEKDLIYLSKENTKCDVDLFRDGLHNTETIQSMKKTASIWQGGFLKGFILKIVIVFPIGNTLKNRIFYWNIESCLKK